MGLLEELQEASRIEAVQVIMAGVVRVEFVITELTEEVLAYLREWGLSLLVTTYALSGEVTASVTQETSGHYEYGDYFDPEYSVSVENEQVIVATQTLITDF